MNKIIFTDVIISKGYKDAPALRFNDKKTTVQFKIGQRVYDRNAADNHRYINIAVKAFSPLSERIEKMQIKEGSRINISGRLDEENWEDNGQKLSRFVIIADEIEYASSASDSGKSNGSGSNGAGSAPPVQNGNGQGTPPPTAQQNSSGDETGMPANFNGFDNFNDGSANDFFPAN
jgi:single-stranded DNA-binding protein